MEKFPGMSFKSKNKKQGKSIIQFVAYKTDGTESQGAEEAQRWSERVRASEGARSDSHVFVCKSFNWRFIMCTLSPHRLINQGTESRHLHKQTYLLLILWMLRVNCCISQLRLSKQRGWSNIWEEFCLHQAGVVVFSLTSCELGLAENGQTSFGLMIPDGDISTGHLTGHPWAGAAVYDFCNVASLRALLA